MNLVLKDIDILELFELYGFNFEFNYVFGGVFCLNLYVIIELKFRFILLVKDN